MSTAASQALVQKLYVAYYGRPADPAGLEAWALAIDANKGQVSTAIVNAFGASAESTALFGNMSTSQKVNAIYKQLFGRDAEPAGLLAWATAIDGGRVSAAGAALEILNGAAGDDKTTINNKLSAAAAFTAALDTTAEITAYSGDTVANAARSFLAGVTTATPSTDAVNTAVASVTNTSGSGSNEAGKSYVLTTNQDVLAGTNSGDFFRAVAGNTVGTQDQTTLNSSDIIDGGTGTDALIVNLVGGDYKGGARIKNIETLQIGTNDTLAAGRTFDYNVNAGSNEVTEVTTIVADQINVGEQLTVNNILKTGSAIPTLKWDNEANSTAGTFATTFRESAVSGDTEVKLVLDDVKAGVFNLGTGANASVETLRVVSQGSTANTLNASSNSDSTAGVDLVGASTDGTNDNGALKTVIVEGAQAFGKAAGVVATAGATQGLTDRTVGVDTGFDAAATQSNLISVAATVTEVDASASTGGVNVRFTPRVNGAEVAQVFKGGDGADYVEFEVGNVNATGGKGNDTFAFVNGGFNSTLTVADSLAGGEGTDTIQIGVNGAASAGQQTYTLDWTEFNNKTGIDVLDLRGNVNTVTLSDSFVAASDAGLTVRTDKIVQTSATDSANPATSTARQEDNSVNTINLTKLSAGRAVTVEGGSGSDRVVANEQSLTASTVVRGGANVGNNGAAAVAGDYDTITVVDNAVLSRGDLSNVSGVEGIALVKSDNTSGRQFSLEITQAFLTNNAQATDVAAATSTLTDTVFSIVTGAAANANSLTAGDTVTIDVSDLYTNGVVGGGLKAGIGARTIDVSSLAAAGVTVVIRDSSGVVAAPVITGTGAGAASADALIALGSAALNVGNGGVVLTGTGANDAFTLTAANQSVNALEGNDTITSAVAGALTGTFNGGAGTDTLVLTNGDSINGATLTSIENITVGTAAGAELATMSIAQFAAATVTAGATDTVSFADAGTVATQAGVANYQLANGANSLNVGTAVTNVTGNAGVDNVTISYTNLNAATLVDAAAGNADVLNITGAAGAAGYAGTEAANFEQVNLQGGITTAGATFVVNNGAGVVTNLTSVTGQSSGVVQVGTGGQTINVVGNTNGTYTLRGNTGADSFNLSGLTTGSAVTVDIATSPSLIGAMDTITGFRAGAGADVISTGNYTAGTDAFTALTIANASVEGLAGSLATAIAADVAVTAANYNATGDAYVVTVSAGTASGVYLVVNQGAVTNSAFDATEDHVVKLVGTVGTLIATDLA